MKPSLDGVYIRIGRAEEHIRSLTELQQPIETVPLDQIKVHPAAPAGRLPDGRVVSYSPTIELPEALSDPQWSVLVGEAIYNLRAALDYLTFELARLDSASEKKGTQFPICSSPDVFQNGVKRGYLRGIKASHRAVIEGLQPYNGGRWLEQLAELSNPDKHRELITTTTQNMGTFTMAPQPEAVPGVKHIVVEMQFARCIAFTDRTPVIPTLADLLAQVTDTVDQFKAEF